MIHVVEELNTTNRVDKSFNWYANVAVASSLNKSGLTHSARFRRKGRVLQTANINVTTSNMTVVDCSLTCCLVNESLSFRIFKIELIT